MYDLGNTRLNEGISSKAHVPRDVFLQNAQKRQSRSQEVGWWSPWTEVRGEWGVTASFLRWGRCSKMDRGVGCTTQWEVSSQWLVQFKWVNLSQLSCHLGSTSQNYPEMPPHTTRIATMEKTKVLARIWRKGNPCAVLVGMYISTATVGKCGGSSKN